jgi:hypothetical protein
VELLFLALAASVSMASLMLWRKAQRSRPGEPPRLPAPSERTALTVQLGDIVEHLDRDWLVEGALALSETTRAARLCRLMDGAEERFLWAGTQAEGDAFLLAQLEHVPEGRAETAVHDGLHLRLERRWRATTLTAGKLGKRIIEAELAVYEYVGAGGRMLLLFEGTQRTLAFAGERLLPHAFEILPGKGL